MKCAVCIGNGMSRKNFVLQKIKDVGPTYGCNQLIEHFELDNTIIVDRPLLLEFMGRGFNNRTNLYTREKWTKTVNGVNPLVVPQFERRHRWDNEQHWGSGIHALNLAAIQYPDIIIMVGYDLWTENIYSGKLVDPNCWIYQMSRIFEIYSSINFVQIQPTGWKCPEQWNTSNLMIDNHEKLEELIPILTS